MYSLKKQKKGRKEKGKRKIREKPLLSLLPISLPIAETQQPLLVSHLLLAYFLGKVRFSEKIRNFFLWGKRRLCPTIYGAAVRTVGNGGVKEE